MVDDHHQREHASLSITLSLSSFILVRHLRHRLRNNKWTQREEIEFPVVLVALV